MKGFYFLLFLFLIVLPVRLFPDYGEFQSIRNFTPQQYRGHKQNWAVVQDNRGIMYFANSAGILEFDSEQWRSIPLPDRSGAYSLAKTPNGRIYVGGRGDLGYLEADDSGLMQFKSIKDKLPKSLQGGKDRVIQTEVTPEGTIFLFERLLVIINGDRTEVFTAKKHFYCFFYTRKTLYVIDDARGFLQRRGSYLVPVSGGRWLQGYVMLPLKNDRILIVTAQKGPIIYDPRSQDGTFKPFSVESSGFFTNNIISCGVVLNGRPGRYRLVLGSLEKGIAVFNSRGREVEYLDIHHGLQSRHVYGLYRDSAGHVWAALDTGISLLYMPDDKPAHQNEAILKGVTYPGVGGGTIYRPVPSATPTSPGAATGTAGKPVPFAALMRRCRRHTDDSMIFGGAFFNRYNRIQALAQPEHQIPSVPYAYNGLRFNFSSNNFEQIELTEYQCYLENLDKGWSNWMKRNTREYTSLHWGTYTFRVRARNHRGEISREASYMFYVRPPWYETWWFLSSQVMFILMMLVLSRVMERMGRAARFSNHMIIFVVVIIFEYVNGFIGPIIGRYSDNIAFFGMLMTAALSFVIGPAQDFIMNILKKIIRGK